MNLSEPLQPSGPLPMGAGHSLQAGDTLEGFEITRVLGRTSFGVLYLATHAADRSLAAIKEYLPSSVAARNAEGQIELTDHLHAEAYQRGLQSFITEALTLSQFDHPHLLRVSCVWEANGTAYRAMPYLSGTTLLAQRSNAREPVSQQQLQAVLEGLLSALETLNGAGLAHGQVEPINIFLPQDGPPVLMDFDAVHHAVLSDLRRPHLDAYADPARTQQTITSDLQAVAAVLHFAVSGDWSAMRPGEARRYPPLAEVLLRFKDSASVLDYQPEFLSAIDTALALAPQSRPRSVAQFRALFETRPQAAAEPAEPLEAPPRTSKRQGTPPPRVHPLNSTESVLALLASFDRGPAQAADDAEPFHSPAVPTLTEEAEPTLPPMRSSLFDAMEAGEALPHDGVGYGPIVHSPMPRVARNPWRRRALMAGIAMAVAGSLAALGWQLFG